MSTIRVGVLRGGPSEEYEVSMKTGSSVLGALDTNRFTPVDIVITKSGEWLIGGYARFPEQILCTLDVVFNALHGTYGEDGTVQKTLDLHGARYTGSTAYASRIAMHKLLTKDHLADLGIKMAPHMLVSESAAENIHRVSDSIVNLFGPQYVIKPVASGSSKGTIIVPNAASLPGALTKALSEYSQVMVEKKITGTEATCGVVERFRDQKLYVLPPIEIVPPQGSDFFDYNVKYDGSTEEICPGRFSRNIKDELMDISRTVHTTLGLSQYSRSDFIVADDGVYFLEVNTLPGLTPESLLPKAIDAVGGTYSGFVTHLIDDALAARR